MYSYATYYQIVRDLEANMAAIANLSTSANNRVTPSLDQDKVMSKAREVTQRFESICRQWFVPEKRTEYYDSIWNQNIDLKRGTLDLGFPLSKVTLVTLGDTSTPVIDTDVRLRPRGRTPAYTLQMITNSFTWSQYSDNWKEAIEITGEWVARRDYTTLGWIDSGDSIQDAAGINATATEVTVTSANANNTNGVAPRFDFGQLIRVTTDDTDEYMIVTDVDYDTEKITVLRGQRGTTAAIHANDTQIDVFIVEPEVVEACGLAVAYEISRIGKYDQVTVGGGGFSAQQFPPDWPARVKSILNPHWVLLKLRAI